MRANRSRVIAPLALTFALCGCSTLLGIEDPEGYRDSGHPVTGDDHDAASPHPEDADPTRDGGASDPHTDASPPPAHDHERDAATPTPDEPDGAMPRLPSPPSQLGPIAAVNGERAAVMFASSTWAPDTVRTYEPHNAFDGDDTTGWCAAAKSPGKVGYGSEETFDDEWRITFLAPQTLGAIHMRSGWPRAEDVDSQVRTGSQKVRDFSWVYRTEDGPWMPIPEASLVANRYQLIFRFAPIEGVIELRLFSRRDPSEAAHLDADAGQSDAPCLREVSFYQQRDAVIHAEPWFYSLATWDEVSHESGAQGNRFSTHRAFVNRLAIRKVVTQLSGLSYTDLEDHLWVGELNDTNVIEQLAEQGPADVAQPACPHRDSRKLRVKLTEGDLRELWDCELPVSAGFPDWVLHEPLPAGILLSDSARALAQRSPRLLSGFYNLVRATSGRIPMLATGGGHQLLAMAQVHASYEAFAREFAPDDAAHVVRPCNHVVAELGEGQPESLCAERLDNGPHWLDRTGGRDDMLFDLIPQGKPFSATLDHASVVVPARLAEGKLSLIASYRGARLDTSPTRDEPAIVQAFKLAGRPVYGTQFRWDQTTRGGCDEDRKNMERVLANFLLLAMNRLDDAGVQVKAHDGKVLPELSDGDKGTSFCPGGPAAATITFPAPTRVRHVQLAKPSDTEARLSFSEDGVTFIPLSSHEVSTEALLGNTLRDELGDACEASAQDPQGSRIVSLDRVVNTRYLRVELDGPAPCLHELNVLALAPETPFGNPERWLPIAADFDGDGKTDPSVWNRDDGRFRARLSGDGEIFQVTWGENSRAQWLPIPGDYDGDGKTDPAIWSTLSGDYWVLMSSGGFGYSADDPYTFMHGHWGDGGGETWQPMPGDYDGDGRHDIGIWSRKDGTFWVLTSRAGFAYDAEDPTSYLTGRWGAEGAELYQPIPQDFDGDGLTDVAVWSKVDGRWSALYSSAKFRHDPLDPLSFVASQLGSDGESLWMPLPADYDGDGRSDMAVWGREYGELYIEKASEGFHDVDWELGFGQYGRWGFRGDQENVALSGHYSGLPESDLAAYHKASGTFWVVRAEAGFTWMPLDPDTYMAVLF